MNRRCGYPAQREHFQEKGISLTMVMLVLLFIVSSCKGQKQQPNSKSPLSISMDGLGNPLTREEINNYILRDTFNVYPISKKYAGQNDSIHFTATIFKAEPLRFKVITGEDATMTLGKAALRIKVNVNNNLFCLTDIDGIYDTSKGKTKCYKVYKEGKDFKLLDTDSTVFKKRIGFFGNHGGDVGFLFTKEVIKEFPDSL